MIKNATFDQIKKRSEETLDWLEESGMRTIYAKMDGVRIRLGLSAGDFSSLMGFSSQYMYYETVRRGRTKLRATQLLTFCKVFEYDIETLTCGAQIVSDDDVIGNEAVACLAGLTPAMQYKIANLISNSNEDEHVKAGAAMAIRELANMMFENRNKV